MTNYDEENTVFNGHYEVEVIIDRPVAGVWTQYLDIGSWVTSHDIENVYGTPGTVGSITRVSFKKAKEMDMPPTHHHYCKIVEMEREKYYLLKTYSEKGGSYGVNLTAFDDAKFSSCNGKTKIVFSVYLEMVAESIANETDPINLDVSRDGMIQNLENLKRICERNLPSCIENES